MSVFEMKKLGNINKKTVSFDDSRKEEQTVKDCGHEGQEWYENLMKHFLKWKKENPNWIAGNRNREPVVTPDTAGLAENSSNNVCLKTLELNEVNHAEKKDAIHRRNQEKHQAQEIWKKKIKEEKLKN